MVGGEGGRRINISWKILVGTAVLSLGFGADPTALFDKLSALTLMKAHPVPFYCNHKKKKVSFISAEIPSVEQEGGPPRH